MARHYFRGIPVEITTHTVGLFGRGMVAAVEAMSGWLDVAEKAAKTNGCSLERITELMRRARTA